jgi:hypothetical protein
MKPLFVAEISERITAGDFLRYDLGTGSSYKHARLHRVGHLIKFGTSKNSIDFIH